MSAAQNESILEALLDSWDRNNAILLNLLAALPQGGLEIKPAKDSHSIARLFTHIHYTRLVFVEEDAPESARPVPPNEWLDERNPDRIAQMLRESAAAVREAVQRKLESGKEMNLHYDHPILFLQHMIWHEGYHHGQIKLVLKLAGQPLSDEIAGTITWDIWMDKTRQP